MNDLYATCLIYDKTLKARMGGNPPKAIENNIPNDYNFYAVINHPEKQGKMLSIVIHNNFDVLLENNIYPNIFIKVIEHEHSEIGERTDIAIPQLGICSISNYTSDNTSEFLFIKMGKEPRLIQPKSYFYNKLEEDNYSFFLQIDEEGYPDNFEYVFAYGALYLYKHNVTGEIIAGFWQYS